MYQSTRCHIPEGLSLVLQKNHISEILSTEKFAVLFQKLYIISKLSKVIFTTRMHTYALQILIPDLMENITSDEQICDMCAVFHLKFCKGILLRKSNCQYHELLTHFHIAFSSAAQRETQRRQQSIELCRRRSQTKEIKVHFLFPLNNYFAVNTSSNAVDLN